MSDTVLALIITVLLLLAMAAWVPLLHLVARLFTSSVRSKARQVPPSRETTLKTGFSREIAQ